MNISTELFKGYVDILLLQCLSRQEMYGYELRQHVFELSHFRCKLSEGTLYPALHKLEKKRYVHHFTKKGQESKRPRIYYRLTPLGERHLLQLLQEWKFLNSLVVTFSKD